jgi:heat shock protein HslJ
MKRLLFLIIAAAAMSSCCDCLKGTQRSQTPVTGEPWRLVQMDGRAFTLGEDDPADSFTITFGDDGRMTGKGACNRLSGTFKNDNNNGTLSFSGIAATRMMCLKYGEQESRFAKLLGSVDAYTIDGLMLMLFTNGEQVLMLERVVPAP